MGRVIQFELMVNAQEELQVQRAIQVQCRQGPISQRRCTDVICLLLYIALLGTVIFLAVFASSGMKKTEAQVEQELRSISGANPLLAIANAIEYIVLSLACVVALSLVLVITSFILPAISAYIFIPLMLLLMLALGAGFVYRFFGKQLPFVSEELQAEYAATHSVVSLVVGVGFLVGFIVSLCVIFAKQQRIKFIVAALSLAKICFWENIYMIFVSIAMSAVSVGALYMNLRFLQVSELQEDGQQIIDKRIFSLLVLVEIIWTHGYLQAYSDFLFQSIAIHWYFNEKKLPRGYSKLGNNLLPSVGLSFRHMGTIVFGWILAYIPESLNVLLHQCEQKAESCYRIFCLCHKCLCESLSKYCYVGTIMYSESFCKSSRIVRDVRVTAKHTFPELYMIGNFYITLMKIFTLLVSIIVCYFLIAEHPKEYTQTLNLIAPLVITLLGSLEISTHFMNSTGLVGDTIYLSYVIDYANESTNFGNLHAQHCPEEAYEVIREAKIGKYAQFD